MGKYIKAYLEAVENALGENDTDYAKLMKEHLTQIEFIKHERLIHLIVTVFVGILLFISMIVYFVSGITAFLAVVILLLALTFAYLAYYYFIENATQKMYRIYNLISMKLEDNGLCEKLYHSEQLTKY